MNFPYTKPYLAELNELKHLFACDFLNGKTLALSGATGMIGSYLIDSLLANKSFSGKIIALVRDEARAKKRFSYYANDFRLQLVLSDLNQTIQINEKVDYVIHGASLTSPHDYHDHPIDTMLLNLIGTKTMLDLAVNQKAKFLFTSSTEVYGHADQNLISEDYLGYLDLLDPRSAYNEGKRAGETLCIAYAAEKGLHVVIARLSRVFGPTLKDSDGKALSQFIARGIAGQPIVLKSLGQQRFSYTYVADAASGIIFLLAHGVTRQAYNIANEEALSLKEIAELVAKTCATKVIIELKNDTNMSYSKAQNALLNIDKIKRLGWTPKVSLAAGLVRTCVVRSSRLSDDQ